MSAPQATASGRLLKPEVLARLSNLELVARAVVDGFMTGLHRSPLFGFSQEFAEYRAYSEGDDPRFVDWNVYARSGKTYIKRYTGETNTQLVVMLDASASMDYGSAGVTKLQYAKFLAATVVWLAAKQHDAIGLTVFDERVRVHQPPAMRTGQLHSILHTIDTTAAASGTQLDVPLARFGKDRHRRGMVAVVSDFYCEPDALLAAVEPLAWQGHDVALFQVLDPEELEPGLRETTLLEDAETGLAREAAPDFMRGRYRERMAAHIAALRQAALGVGALHTLLNTSEPLDQALRDYLLFRQKRG